MSNSLNAALKAHEIAGLGLRIASIEVLAMSKALELRGWETSSSPTVKRIQALAIEALSRASTLGGFVDDVVKILESLYDSGGEG